MDKSALFPLQRTYYVNSSSPRLAGKFVKPSSGFYGSTAEFITPDYDEEIKFVEVDPVTGEPNGTGSHYIHVRYVKLVAKAPIRGVDYELLPHARTHLGSSTNVRAGALVRFLRNAGDSAHNVRISFSQGDGTNGYDSTIREQWVARYFLAETDASTAAAIVTSADESKNKLTARTGLGHALELNGPTDELVDLETLNKLVAELVTAHTARLAAAPARKEVAQLQTALAAVDHLNSALTRAQLTKLARDLHTAGLRKTTGAD